MQSICYIVPFFGSLPDYTQVWLDSCKMNPTINWIIFTDDKTMFNYPENVKVEYVSFSTIKKLIQKNYEFKISLDSAYKLVDYKVAYGEIFNEYLKDYDFWGFCDIDMIWGDMRKFFTDDLLNAYSKIGCQGHSTIFRNEKSINEIYKIDIEGELSYKEAFSKKEICCTDIGFIRKRFEAVDLPIFSETIYAGLMILKPAFFLQAETEDLARLNRRQVFLWDKGSLTRYYLDGKTLCSREYLYIHFFKRPMKNKILSMDKPVLIYPNCYRNWEKEITYSNVSRYGKKSYVSFLIRIAWQNRHKITINRIVELLKAR